MNPDPRKNKPPASSSNTNSPFIDPAIDPELQQWESWLTQQSAESLVKAGPPNESHATGSGQIDPELAEYWIQVGRRRQQADSASHRPIRSQPMAVRSVATHLLTAVATGLVMIGLSFAWHTPLPTAFQTGQRPATEVPAREVPASQSPTAHQSTAHQEAPYDPVSVPATSIPVRRDLSETDRLLVSGAGLRSSGRNTSSQQSLDQVIDQWSHSGSGLANRSAPAVRLPARQDATLLQSRSTLWSFQQTLFPEGNSLNEAPATPR